MPLGVKRQADLPPPYAVMEPDRYSLAAIRRQLADGAKLPSPSEISWLLEHAESLARANRALDHEVARMEAELRVKDAEFSGAESELLDVSEELVKAREQIEALRQAATAAS